MWKCNKCGAENEDSAKLCEVCGTAEATKKNKKRNLIIGIILAAVIVIGVLALIFSSLNKPDNSDAVSYTDIMENNPEITEKDAAFEVNGNKVGKEIWDYYFSSAAKTYANANGGVTLEEIDWDKKDEDGQTALEKVKYDAMSQIIRNAAVSSYAKDWGISLTDEDLNLIEVDLDYWKQVYGDDIYKELGVKDEATFRAVYKDVLLSNRVLNTVSDEPEKYLKGVDLTKYANNRSATIKILGVTKGEGTSVNDNAKAEIDDIKARLDAGEDFDALWLESYESMTGMAAEKPTMETVYENGPTEENVAKAALALSIGETSDVIETSYSYVIITRVAGYTEIENYMVAESDVGINKSMIKESKVK